MFGCVRLVSVIICANCAPQTPTLAYYTKYEEADILHCATALNEMLKRRPTGEPKTLPVVQRKYLSRKYYQVAAIKPLEEL